MDREYFWHFISALIFVSAVLSASFYYSDDFISISVFNFILLALATFRLTHIFVYDKVMDFARDYFAKFDTGIRRAFSELIHCPWCTGTWVAFFILIFHFSTPVSKFFILVLALAGAGLIFEIFAKLLWEKIGSEKGLQQKIKRE